MPTQCFSPILGKRIRVTELDECGLIQPTSRNVVTDGFVTITISAQTEEGTTILVRNASGQICINEKMADSFTRLTVEIAFCNVNPSLLAMVTNAEEYENYAGDVAGFTLAEGEMTGKFAFELWTGMAGQACGEGGEEASGYMLLPLVQSGTLGDIEIGGEDAITFTLTGAYTVGGNAWGSGPYAVIRDGGGAAAALPTALDPYDHLLLVATDVAPPPAACEPSVVPFDATGATAGEPGVFTPLGATPPADLAALQSASPAIIASPSSAWDPDEYVVLGDSSEASWSGTAWVAYP